MAEKEEEKKPSFDIPSLSSVISMLSGGSQAGTMIAPTGGLGGAAEVIQAGSEIPAGFEAVGSAAYQPQLLGSTTAGAFLPAAGVAAGAYTGGQQLSGVMKAAQNQKLSLQEQAALALPTFGASFLVNPAQKLFGSGKDKDQRGRDAYRGGLKDIGFLDENYGLNLKGGAPTNFGSETLADGSKSFDVNFNTGDKARDELTGRVVGALDPLAEVLSGGDAKRRSDLAGQFANAALASEDPMRQVGNIFRRAEATSGLKPSTVKEQLQGLFDSGKIDAGRKEALFNSLNSVYQITR